MLNNYFTKLYKLAAILLTLASNSYLIASATANTIKSYRTISNQVVVTGLQSKTKYSIKTTNFQGRNGTRTITTNSCGEALISNGTAYQRLIINQQNITPSILPKQTHQRCNPRRNKNRTIIQQPLNR